MPGTVRLRLIITDLKLLELNFQKQNITSSMTEPGGQPRVRVPDDAIMRDPANNIQEAEGAGGEEMHRPTIIIGGPKKTSTFTSLSSTPIIAMKRLLRRMKSPTLVLNVPPNSNL